LILFNDLRSERVLRGIDGRALVVFGAWLPLFRVRARAGAALRFHAPMGRARRS